MWVLFIHLNWARGRGGDDTTHLSSWNQINKSLDASKTCPIYTYYVIDDINMKTIESLNLRLPCTSRHSGTCHRLTTSVPVKCKSNTVLLWTSKNNNTTHRRPTITRISFPTDASSKLTFCIPFTHRARIDKVLLCYNRHNAFVYVQNKFRNKKTE